MLTNDDAAPRDRTGRSPMEVFLLGRAMVRSGDLEQGRSLLKRAVEADRELADAWVWLAMTTNKPMEQKDCLDWALAADPSNGAARRWMAVLTGKLKPKDFVAEGGSGSAEPSDQAETATSLRTFLCPKCGGSLKFDPENLNLKCAQCGTTQAVEETQAATAEKAVDYTLPTRQGHAWAQAQRRQTCQQCGAVTIFPPGQTSTACPFCGATAFIAAPEDASLMSPDGILLMEVGAEGVENRLKGWLDQGFFSPDDLLARAHENGLRPAYLPVWIFNCDVTVHWTGRIGTARGRRTEYEWVKEERLINFSKSPAAGRTRSAPRALSADRAFRLEKTSRAQGRTPRRLASRDLRCFARGRNRERPRRDGSVCRCTNEGQSHGRAEFPGFPSGRP